MNALHVVVAMSSAAPKAVYVKLAVQQQVQILCTNTKTDLQKLVSFCSVLQYCVCEQPIFEINGYWLWRSFSKCFRHDCTGYIDSQHTPSFSEGLPPHDDSSELPKGGALERFGQKVGNHVISSTEGDLNFSPCASVADEEKTYIDVTGFLAS